MTIQRNSALFPFSRLVEDTDEAKQRRTEIEDTIAHIERQLDELVEQINAAFASDQTSDDLLSSITELNTQVSGLSAEFVALSAQFTALQTSLSDFISINKIVTLSNNVPFLMKHYFAGSLTIESGTTGFIPSGFQNDGLLIVNGILRTI